MAAIAPGSPPWTAQHCYRLSTVCTIILLRRQHYFYHRSGLAYFSSVYIFRLFTICIWNLVCSIDKYTNNLAHARAKYTRPPTIQWGLESRLSKSIAYMLDPEQSRYMQDYHQGVAVSHDPHHEELSSIWTTVASWEYFSTILCESPEARSFTNNYCAPKCSRKSYKKMVMILLLIIFLDEFKTKLKAFFRISILSIDDKLPLMQKMS